MSFKLGLYSLLFLTVLPVQNIFGQLHADFEVVYISQCPPGVINIINRSENYTTCEWTFGNGNSSYSTVDTLNQVYPNFGEYTIELAISDGIDTQHASRTIYIFKEPEASFVTNISTGCVPMTVTFTENAIQGDAPISNYYWDFRNGTVLQDQNPTLTFNNLGEFDVLLRVSDTNGCTSFLEIENYIKTFSQPNAMFSFTPNYSCSTPVDIEFTNETSTSLPLNYSWDFGDGNQSSSSDPIHTYTEVGTYPISLLASNSMGCASTASGTMDVAELLESIFEIYKGDSTLVNNGDTICRASLGMKNTSSTLGMAYWQINGTSFGTSDSLVYSGWIAGWNVIRLAPFSTESCVSSIEKRIYVHTVNADFSVSEVRCEFPLTVNFTNNSTGAASYRWVLAQNNTSTDQNPVIELEDIYIRNDYTDNWPNYSYANKLIATSANGCVDSVSQSIHFQHPEAKIRPDLVKGCIPLDVELTDTSESSLEIVNRIWNIPVDTAGMPDHKALYRVTTAGDHNVTLLVENERHCRDTASVTIQAGDLLNPAFDFSPKAACYNDTITFVDLTGDQELIDYWSYSSTANLYSVCEQDPNPDLPLGATKTGYHDITLAVEYNGCPSSVTYPNALYVRGPIARTDHSIDCSNPTEISFVSEMDLVSSFSWDFGDGTFNAVDMNPTHIFLSNSDYSTHLTVFNDTTSCSQQIQENISVRQIEAALNLDTALCVGDNLVLDASGSKDVINACYLEGYKWILNEFDPPRQTYKDNIRQLFTVKGTHEVKLIVKDINGCQDSISKTVHVYQPKAEFTMDTSTGCVPQVPIFFTNTSNDTSIVEFKWDFGDLTSVNNADTLTHIYNSANERSYLARLFTYDQYGCNNSYSQTVNIYKPNAGFSSTEQDICVGTTLNFLTNYTTQDSSYWQFGNGAFEKQNSEFTFDTSGKYNVTHKVFIGNCVDSVTRLEYISVEKAVADIVASDTVAECYPQTILFDHVNTGDSVLSGGWDFDFKGHLSEGYITNPSFSYSLPGVFYPSLSVITRNGCTDKDSIEITVKGPYAEYAISNRYPCKEELVSFSMTVEEDVFEQLWDFGDGLASQERSPTYSYSFVDTIITSLTVSDINGCTPPAMYDTVFLKNVISDFSFVANDTQMCVFEEIFPHNSSVGAVNYRWKSNGSEISREENIQNFSLSNPGEYLLLLEIDDGNNCSDTSFQKIIVFPLPNVSITASDSICVDVETARLQAHTDSANSVVWTPAEVVDDAYAYTTVATPNSTTEFFVVATDTVGCQSSDSTEVYVHQYPRIYRYPEADTIILIGEQVSLIIASSNPSTFSWDSEDISELKNADTLTILTLENAIYTVDVEDFCFSSTEDFEIGVREIYTVVLPDVFTPNGDGVNDRIYVRGGGIKELLEFKIYNRYGNQVYYSDDITEGWNGYYNGKLQNADIYTYFVTVITYTDEEVSASGSFNLIQ